MKLQNIRFILIILSFTLFGLYGNAEAGWQKTKWGMTIKEIHAVMPGQVKEIKEIPENIKSHIVSGAKYCIPEYTIGEHTFNVAMLFNNQEKLEAVVLHHVGDNKYGCFLYIKRELKKKYGEP